MFLRCVTWEGGAVVWENKGLRKENPRLADLISSCCVWVWLQATGIVCCYWGCNKPPIIRCHGSIGLGLQPPHWFDPLSRNLS